jgi:hypothetical protein
MTEIREKRLTSRILAVCRAFDLDGNFLGLTLDLTRNGIHLIISNTFPDLDKFSFVLHQIMEEEENKPHIIIQVEKVWRKSTHEEYDEIGCKIIDVDLEDEFKKLIKYCDNNVKKIYQLELDVNVLK